MGWTTGLRARRWSTPVAAAAAVVVAGIVVGLVLATGGSGDIGEPPAGAAEPAASTTSTTEPPPVEVVLAFSGDILPHTPVMDQAASYARQAAGPEQGAAPQFDFGPMFAEVAPLIRSADLAVCHMEVPVSADNRGLSSYPVFNAPREIVAAVGNTGYDACTTASNHSLDKGMAGITSTLEVFDGEGLVAEGTARSALEGAVPTIFVVEGFRIGLVSATYGLNGFTRPTDAPWSVNLWDAETVLAEAAAAKAAGADFVVASLHWGVEYTHEPTAEQRRLAQELTSSPLIDAIVGHHAHVLQPVERINGKVVAFGLGNFLSNQSPACCPAASQDGAVLFLTLRGDPWRPEPPEVVDVSYAPTWVDRSGFVIRSLAGAPELAGDLARSRERTVAVLSRFPDAARPME